MRGEMPQNAASDKKSPSYESCDYFSVIKELEKQSKRSTIEIEVANQIYRFKTSPQDLTLDLENKLAEKIYNSIRESDTDISDIASHLGIKKKNIKNVKDHIFYNSHKLDY